MTIPEGLRPVCQLTKESQLTFWGMMTAVRRCLVRNHKVDQAHEFVRRAMDLDVDNTDTTDLLALAVDYVEVD